MEEKAYLLSLYEKAMPQTITDWREKLLLTKESGFDSLEISIDESEAKQARLDWTAAEITDLRAAMAETGVPIRTMCLSGHRKWPMGAHDPATRERSIQIMKKAILLAEQLGVRLIQLAGYDVYYEEGDAQTQAWFAENLHAMGLYAAAHSVCMGFETMETPFMDTVGKAMYYVAQNNNPYLGVYPDIGNLKNAAVKYGTDLVGDIALGSGHIFAAHLKETQPGVYRDMTFGTGHTEYLPCIRALWGQGVRLYTGEFWDHGEADYRLRLRSASVFLRAKIEQAAGLAEAER